MSKALSEVKTGDVRRPIKKPVKRLAWYTHHRDYRRLRDLVGALMEDHGWRETFSLIKQIPIWTESVTHKWATAQRPGNVGVIPVRRGKLRDGLLRVLGLEGVTGIDVDLLRTFGSFRTSDIQTLRERAISKALRILRYQVERGTTFFLDTKKMVGTPLEPLVPAIMEHRERELLSLGNRSTPSRLAGTYYGFSSYIETLTSVEAKLVKGLETTPIRMTQSRPSYRRTIYRNCSEDLTDLLLNLLRAALAVPQVLERAGIALGVRGDSRAIGSLEIGLERAHQSWRASRAFATIIKFNWALMEVGYPKTN